MTLINSSSIHSSSSIHIKSSIPSGSAHNKRIVLPISETEIKESFQNA